MHIFLQIFVREKTLKVLPTKLLVGNDGESRSNGREWGGGSTKCVEIFRKPSALSYNNIHKCFTIRTLARPFVRSTLTQTEVLIDSNNHINKI